MRRSSRLTGVQAVRQDLRTKRWETENASGAELQ